MLLKDRYELGSLIGEGGFGKTYAASDASSGELVVVKELTLRGLPDWKPVEHFEREAKVLASLDHPGVPGFVEAFTLEDEGGDLRYYIVSEKIAGETLQARIEAGFRWSAAEALALTRGLLETLDYLHSIVPPVIHRDIKPANVVLRENGAPVLVDFGAVRDLALSGNTMATVLGTPGYMAPEQSLGRSDARSDLYGLGATLAHVFTHGHPQELLDESMRLDARALADLPESVRTIVVALTQPDPASRPSSAREALAPPKPAPPNPAALALASGEHLPAPSSGRATPKAVRQNAMMATMRPQSIKLRVLPVIGAGFVTILGGVVLSPKIIAATPFVVLAAFANFIGRSQLDGRRGRKAAELGTKTTGKLTAANAGQQGTFLEFSYEVEGQTYEGHGYTRDALAVAKLEKGSPVFVYYDPEHPERSYGSLEDF